MEPASRNRSRVVDLVRAVGTNRTRLGVGLGASGLASASRRVPRALTNRRGVLRSSYVRSNFHVFSYYNRSTTSRRPLNRDRAEPRPRPRATDHASWPATMPPWPRDQRLVYASYSVVLREIPDFLCQIEVFFTRDIVVRCTSSRIGRLTIPTVGLCPLGTRCQYDTRTTRSQ